MPVKVRKSGKKYRVTDGRRTYGTHGSKAKANRQARAINASMSRRKKR